MDPWRNGSASDSRSEGCVFDSRRVQSPSFWEIFWFSLLRYFFGSYLPLVANYQEKSDTNNVFDSVVAGAFQITFRVKMNINNIFSFFKNYFWHQHIKTIQNVQTILNFSKKINFKFFGNADWTAFPNSS